MLFVFQPSSAHAASESGSTVTATVRIRPPTLSEAAMVQVSSSYFVGSIMVREAGMSLLNVLANSSFPFLIVKKGKW
jgi:uncharacterized membrane protein